jgi:subtilisin family serine protease
MSVGFISLSDGLALRVTPNTTVQFPVSPQVNVVPNHITGGFITSSSSWGPTNELGPYPHVAAPGGEIFSTLPLVQGGFGVLSGTSMSAPYIAGVAALYTSTKGPVDPLNLRSLMSTTATSVDFNNGVRTFKGLKSPTVQQGAGLIHADNMMRTTTLLSPDFLSLNVSRLPTF